MKKSLLLLTVFSCWISNYTWASSGFTPGKEHQIFQTIATDPFDSPVETNGFVFMQIKWTCNKGESNRERGARKLRAIYNAISGYVMPENPVFTHSPFGPKLTKLLENQHAFQVHNIPYSMVWKSSKDRSYTEVLAFNAEALHLAREQTLALMKKNDPGSNDSEWLGLLKKVYQVYSSTDAGKEQFFSLLDCPIITFMLPSRKSSFDVTNREYTAAEKEVADFISWLRSDSSFYGQHPELTWENAVKRKDTLFFTEWKEQDGGLFDQAKKAFSLGENIDKIIGLLSESISANPIHADKWCFLGASLDVKGQHKDALFAYLQAYKIDPENEYARPGIFKQISLSGLELNAKALKWYLKLIK